MFYAIAALGSTIGQIWVGATIPPWPDQIPWAWRALLVAPFAIVIDLGGVVTSAFADARQRLGEAAYGWRALSAGSVVTGVGINIVGHADVPYLAVVFGGLGVFAYTVWLLHAAARRRDALRNAGKLADTAPAYGLMQWCREPAVTRRARALARAHGHGLHESLAAARSQIRDEKRRTALATHLQALIQGRHQDPVVAAIAVTTLDVDAVDARLTADADVAGWARVIGADLHPPAPRPIAEAAAPALGGAASPLPVDLMRRIPVNADAYRRWLAVWEELVHDAPADLDNVARRHDFSRRQVEFIRRAGQAGLLDSPIPPAVRLAHHNSANGRAARPHEPTDTE